LCDDTGAARAALQLTPRTLAGEVGLKPTPPRLHCIDATVSSFSLRVTSARLIMKHLHLDHLCLVVAVAFALLTGVALVGEAVQSAAPGVVVMHDRAGEEPVSGSA
jgi:hypothetical protein